MADFVTAIALVRDAVCALLRVSAAPAVAGQFQVSIVGTTWCVAPTGSFLTAFHVLNGGNPRDPAHKYYVLRAPGNGRVLQQWPVTAFHLEDAARDLALLEAPLPASIVVPAIAIAPSRPPDGTAVLTYGCPAPMVTGAGVDAQGNLTAIQTVLFTHANTGVVAAQYPASPLNDIIYEFNVGWHHGESGGPVLQLEPQVGALAVMQHYRNIQGPHGTMAGPRRGFSLGAIQSALAGVGATFV